MHNDLITFILNIGTSIIIGGGTGLTIVVLLSKKILDQILKKDIEKFKTELSCELKLNQEMNKFNFDEEVKIIKILWKHTAEVVDCCSTYQGTKNNSQLSELNKKLDTFISQNKPFIHVTIEESLGQLLEIANVEKYNSSEFNHVDEIRQRLIESIRQRLNLF